MQLVLNFKSAVVSVALVTVGYYAYRSTFADAGTRDIGKLLRSHRDAQHARQLILKRRILAVYDTSRDYADVERALDSASPVTQALAVEILAEKSGPKAKAKLLEMLADPGRDDVVKEALAGAFASVHTKEAIPRLVELTDVSEAPGVRASAHHTLQALTGVVGEIKLGDATRQHWTLWLRNNKGSGLR